jgi:hypothetical protein
VQGDHGPSESATVSLCGSDNDSATQNRLAEPPKKKSKVDRSLTIYDEHEQAFVGHFVTGNSTRGSGRFEHTHESDDDDLNGKVTVYQGEFAERYFEGRGRLNHARGSVFEGIFKKGSPNGPGTCDWANGWRYVGDWRQDERHGKGKLMEINRETKEVIANGEQYEGEWRDDKQHVSRVKQAWISNVLSCRRETALIIDKHRDKERSNSKVEDT